MKRRTSTSSSTISTVRPPAPGVGPRTAPVGGCDPATAVAGAAARMAGSQTRTVVPRPGALSTAMAPRWPRTMPSVAESPSPRPRNFVVKKGSNMQACVASSIPAPVSATASST